MKNYIRCSIIILSISMFVPGIYAAWGDFDTTFGVLGVSLDGTTNHYPLGVAIQLDGKILITGYRLVGGKPRFFLRRYLANGQVDSSFGNNGSAISNPLIVIDAHYRGETIVVQSNGKIAVLGLGNNIPTIWRFHSSGTADTSMGNGGMRPVSGYSQGLTRDLATYSNILYVGLTKPDYSSGAVVKFNSNGTRDMAFGNAGELLPSSYLYFTLDTEAGTGNILIGGKKNTSPYGIERFLPTGQLDPTFNHYDTTYRGTTGTFPSSFIRLANGQFVLNETWYPITNFPQPLTTGANLVHFATNGEYLGRTVYVPTEEGQEVEWGPCPKILAQQSDNRVIAKSVHYDKLYRFSASFTTVQTMTCGSYTSLENPTAAVLQADNKMVAAGRYSGNIAIVRTLP